MLCLPTGSSVTSADIDRVCAIIRLALEDGRRVRARLDELGPPT
jgi:hypothetical protein